jgi:DNA uptake protein ComE-like DNA-binding protein
MKWWNKLATRFALRRMEMAAIAMLCGVFLMGLVVKFYGQYESRTTLVAALETDAFQGTEPDSVIQNELAAYRSQNPNPNQPQSAPRVKLNLNTATEAELDALPEIGKILAERLIRFRKFKGGTIRSIDELADVKGIDPERLAKLKNYLEVRE